MLSQYTEALCIQELLIAVKLAQKGFGKAKMAAGRKLGLRLGIMLRDNLNYQQFCRRARQTRDADAEMPGR